MWNLSGSGIEVAASSSPAPLVVHMGSAPTGTIYRMNTAGAIKLVGLLESLAPPVVGNVRDIDEAIALALRTKGRVEAPFEANRPCHVLLHDIAANVIGFLNNVPKFEEKHTPGDKMCYYAPAYPFLRGFPVQLVVQSPQVAVTDVLQKGMGVVATNDIPANRIVTFYPVDIVRIRQYPESLKVGPSTYFVKSKEHTKLTSSRGGVEDAFGKYKYSVANVDIYGDPKEYSGGCCGHMINDGDGPIKGTNNCVLQPLFGGVCFAVITLVAIGNGDELMMSYGPHYWK